MACPVRTYPRKQPPKWKPPVPRWQLVLPKEVKAVYTFYIGVQQHRKSAEDTAFSKAIASITSWLDSAKPSVVDAFINETGHDLPGTRVWVCYWTDQTLSDSAISNLDLVGIYNSPDSSARSSIGLWTESFTTPISRLETNYAGLHESPGVARLPGNKREEHTLSAYWGAARDRIPDSREDVFELPGTEPPNSDYDPEDAKTHPTERLETKSDAVEIQLPDPMPKGFGQRLTGTSYDNMVHIRSGQCWEQCDQDEAAAYEENLQKSLMKGMGHLWENPIETGTLGLRWLRNVVPTAEKSNGAVNGDHTSHRTSNFGGRGVKEINETCGAGFFRNLRDLELWSSSHPTHKAIFAGAHKHAREWGPDRKFMTWHEVSVLKKGEARWEYVNCDPKTGVVRFVKMEGVEELE